ncbi:MAG: ABC transporter permease [Ferruginibacter sp.]
MKKPIGKVINADDKIDFTVTGVIKDFPKNSSIREDMILPMSLQIKNWNQSRKDGKTADADFTEFSYQTYLLLQPNTNTTALADKIRQIHLRNKADDTDVLYLLQALPQMHLYKADGTDGGIETVRMFIIICFADFGNCLYQLCKSFYSTFYVTCKGNQLA